MKEQYGDLVVMYSNKSDGNMAQRFSIEFDDADKNRREFVKKMGFDINRFLFMQVNNEDKVVELKDNIDDHLYYKFIEADAIICKDPDIFLYLSFADCIPFTLYDRRQNIFAFAHLGWRSTYLNLHQKLFSMFQDLYGSHIDDLLVHIGPSIKKDSYILENLKQREDDEWKPYIKNYKDNLYMLDLRGYVKDFFLHNGLREDQILVSDIDTGSDPNYFSHYRAVHSNEKEGRFFYAVGMLKKEE